MTTPKRDGRAPTRGLFDGIASPRRAASASASVQPSVGADKPDAASQPDSLWSRVNKAIPANTPRRTTSATIVSAAVRPPTKAPPAQIKAAGEPVDALAPKDPFVIDSHHMADGASNPEDQLLTQRTARDVEQTLAQAIGERSPRFRVGLGDEHFSTNRLFAKRRHARALARLHEDRFLPL